jgi:hypothetical protein
MQGNAFMRLALCVGMIVAGALALAACGSGSAQQEEAKARPLPEAGQSLRPGEYRTDEFKPSFSLRVGKGWSTLAPEVSDALALSSQGETRWIGFTNVQEVFKPTAKGTLSGNSNVVKAPKDLVGWFHHHPYLQTEKPQNVTVGGVKGEQFDLVVEVPEAYYGACGSDCMDIYMLGSGETVGFEDGNKTRIIVLEDVKGEMVAFDIGVSQSSEFDEFLPEAQKVVDSVEWGGS